MQRMKESVLILGGGADQKLLVAEFKKRGFYTIIVDYYENPPAKGIADKHYKESTYNQNEILEIAKKENVKFVTTISTDQPILVAAYVSEVMNLKFQISFDQAKNITNKKYMKSILHKNYIPTAKSVILDKDFSIVDFNFELRYPLIIKPVDSSGSRGVFIINNESELLENYKKSLEFSNTKDVVCEEFIDGQEISVDAVVVNKKSTVLVVTDGFKTYTNDSSPTPLYNQNIYPTKISSTAYKKISLISQAVATAFNIDNSPLFLQMIVSNDDVFVIEFSARIAGGSKPYIIPLISNVDIVNTYVSMLLEEEIHLNQIPSDEVFSLNHIYSIGGVFQCFLGVDELIAEGLIERFISYQQVNSIVRKPNNGSDRIGAFIVKGKSYSEVSIKTKIIDNRLKALDNNSIDIILHNILTK